VVGRIIGRLVVRMRKKFVIRMTNFRHGLNHLFLKGTGFSPSMKTMTNAASAAEGLALDHPDSGSRP
jgi:hypothetical protein